ncbi:unnamed protein product, partial [Ectocarpus fasciculatus]
IIEAVVVGIVIVLMGYHCSMIALEILPMKDDDHRSVMHLSLFLVELFSHLLLEVSKVNAWYRSNG